MSPRRPPPRPLDFVRPGYAHAPPARHADSLSPYFDVESPLSPVTPAVLGTARLWQSPPGLTPQIVEIAASSVAESSRHGLRGGRDYSPQSIADCSNASLRKDAWVRRRNEHSPRFPFGLRSPLLQFVVGGLVFVASLTTFLTLRQTEKLETSLQITFVFLVILSGILVIHSSVRMLLGQQHGFMVREKHYRSGHKRHRRHHHRSRHDLESRYQEPDSPFDQLPCDDSLFSPITPVRVHLLHDEEAFLREKEHGDNESPLPSADLLTPPPPAYGQWRCSVRADPNLLHWERCADDRNSKDLYTAAQEMVQRPAPLARGITPQRTPTYRSWRGEEVREDDTGVTMEPGAFVEAVVDDVQARRASMAVEEAGRMLRGGS